VNAALASFVKIGPNQYNSITNEAVAFTQAGLLTTPVDTQTLYSTQFNALVATLPKAEKVTEERDMTTEEVHPSLRRVGRSSRQDR